MAWRSGVRSLLPARMTEASQLQSYVRTDDVGTSSVTMDSELPGAAARLMASETAGSSPVESASGNVMACSPSRPMIYSQSFAVASPAPPESPARTSCTASMRSRLITSLSCRPATYANSERVAKKKRIVASTMKPKRTLLRSAISACRGLGILGLVPTSAVVKRNPLEPVAQLVRVAT